MGAHRKRKPPITAAFCRSIAANRVRGKACGRRMLAKAKAVGGSSAAMESIGRNPNSTGQLFTPMIIALAFIEALTLYAFVVAYLLQLKI